MKAVLPLLVALATYSCTAERELQMDMVEVELVKIDTTQRYFYQKEKILTWRSDKQVDYITFEPMATSYILGSRMKVMVKR